MDKFWRNVIISSIDVKHTMDLFIDPARPVHIDDLISQFIQSTVKRHHPHASPTFLEDRCIDAWYQSSESLKRQFNHQLNQNDGPFIGYCDYWLDRIHLQSRSSIDPEKIFRFLCRHNFGTVNNLDRIHSCFFGSAGSTQEIFLQRFLLGAILSENHKMFERVSADEWRLSRTMLRYREEACKTKSALQALAAEKAAWKAARRAANKAAAADAARQEAKRKSAERAIREVEALRLREERRAYHQVEIERQASTERQAKKRLEKAAADMDLKRLAEKNLLKVEMERRESHLQWVETVRKVAKQGRVCPGQIVTVEDSNNSTAFSFYLVESEVTNGFRAGMQYTASTYKTFIPNMAKDLEIISTNAPLGRAVNNCRVGSSVVVAVPEGKITYTIANVKMPNDMTYVRQEANQDGKTRFDSESSRIYEGRGRDSVLSSDISVIGQEVGSCSDYQDASKYGGFMARDNGTYGSFPGHDDYGDESDA